MRDEIVEIGVAEDGCFYQYNVTHKIWQKICDVSVDELPESVKNAVKQMYESIFK